MKQILKLTVLLLLTAALMVAAVPVSAVSFTAIQKDPNYQYGVDVSQWNGESNGKYGVVDWAYLRKIGVEFAYIRVGTYHKWGGDPDPAFKENVKKCVENGIEFGVYVYSYVYKKSDNKKCAKWVLDRLKSLGNYTKDADTIQVAYDIEDDVQANAVYYGRCSKRYMTDSVRHFTQSVSKSGYLATVYASRSFFSDYLMPELFRKDGTKLWCAQWPYYPDTTSVKKLRDNSPADVWQFSENIKIKSGLYDGNVAYNGMYDYANEDSTLRIEGVNSSYKYSAAGVKPEVSVYDGDQLLKKGKDYKLYYFNNKRIGTAKIKIIRYSNSKYIETKTVLFEIVPPITGMKTVSTGDEITLSWNKIPYASYYQIYEYDPSDGTYSLIDTTKSNYYCDFELEEGTNYKLKVRAVYRKNGTEFYGDFKKVSATTLYKKMTGISAEYIGDNKIKLSWNPKNDNCEGYEIEVSSDAAFGKSVIRTVLDMNKKSRTFKNLKSNKTYYFRIRSFNTVKTEKIYSEHSGRVSAAVL